MTPTATAIVVKDFGVRDYLGTSGAFVFLRFGDVRRFGLTKERRRQLVSRGVYPGWITSLEGAARGGLAFRAILTPFSIQRAEFFPQNALEIGAGNVFSRQQLGLGRLQS